MNTKSLTLIIVIAAIVLLGGCGCSGYNSLIKLDENVKNKWAGVQSDYQRRSDLIPNLVASVKGAAKFEQETLTQVTQARANASKVQINAGDLTQDKINQFQAAQGELQSSLSRLLVTVEKYPELKANQNFLNLQAQLEGTENRIKVSRNDYNASAQEFNSTSRRFPNNIFAGMFGFKPKAYFQSEAGAEKAPEVKF